MKKRQLWLFLFALFTLGNALAQPLTKAQKKTINKLEQSLTSYALTSCEQQLAKELSQVSDTHSLFYNALIFTKARLQKEQGNYLLAAKTAETAAQAFQEKATSLLTAQALSLQASLLIELAQSEEAEQLLQQALTIYQEQKDKSSIDYATTIFYFGKLRQEQEAYEAADSLFAIAQPIAKKRDPLLHILLLNELAISQLEQEKFEETAVNLQEAEELTEQFFGREHPAMGYVYYHFSRYFDKIGNLPKAQDYIEKALTVREKIFGNQHPLYAKVLLNRASFSMKQGQYDKAEEDLLLVKDIFFTAYGETFYYADALFYLGYCYNLLGRVERSIDYWTEAKNVYASAGKLVDYANVLNGLAINYEEQEKFEQAERLYQEGRSVLKNTDNTIFYAALTTNLAELYTKQKKFAEAEALFLEAKIIVTELYGNQHFFYAAVINNLAALYKNTGKYEQAKGLYLQAAAIDKASLGEQHPDYISTLYKLATISALSENYALAFEYYQQANAGQLHLIRNYYSTFDETTRLSYLSQIQLEFERFFSFVFDKKLDDKAMYAHAQNLNLAIKSLALDFSIDNRAMVADLSDSSVSAFSKEWLSLREQLGEAYVLSEEERTQSNINIPDLEEQVELLEKKLARTSAAVASRLEQQEIMDWKQVQQKLSDTEVAIDFIPFSYFPPQGKTDSTFYCALLTKKDDDAPTFIFLAEQKQLARILKADVVQHGNNYVENPSIGYDLYQLLWQPLESYLQGINTVKISPAGLLHRVAFAAIPMDVEGEQVLMDAFQFEYYGNMRDVVNEKETPVLDQSIALLGGANFDLDSISLAAIAEQLQQEKSAELPLEEDILAFAKVENATPIAAADSTRSAVEFNYLPGTAEEVREIGTQFLQHDWKVQTFLGKNALEDEVKRLEDAQAPSILHIATHGYFFAPLEGEVIDTDLRSRILSAKNPLLRSGLVLAGANYGWKGGSRIAGLNDGILTAYEISNLNLFQTNLVVLSACETGLGDIYDTEGVFGLQRAFKAAGVEQLIISLWKVPDQQTLELMQTFYTFYLQSKDATAALYQAQGVMRKKYSPYYWAAFILIN